MAETYTACFREGNFPGNWKRAKLVLISKGKVDLRHDVKARPICLLLNELGKIYERVIVGRMQDFMKDHPSAALSDRQFGFRQGKYTIDTLNSVASFIYKWTRKKQFVISVGLDVRNAFNSIPWTVIRGALRRKDFPIFMRRIIDSYLHDRSIEYPTKGGGFGTRRISCGVPQGSVLGSLLWNIAFNYVIEVRPDSKCMVICYADDMVLGAGATVLDARSRANDQVVAVRIEVLGLSIVPNKTEAVLYYGETRPDVDPVIRVHRTYVTMGSHMRYLVVILDSRMTFLPHFKQVRDKVAVVTKALFRIMPNLRGLEREAQAICVCGRICGALWRPDMG